MSRDGSVSALRPFLGCSAVALTVVLAAPHLLADDLTRETKLVAPVPSADAYFGRSVSIENNLLAAGVPGEREVHLFELEPSGWVRTDRILPFGNYGHTGFGYDVDLDGDRLLVGAYRADGLQSQGGAAYLYRRDSQGWTPEARLISPDGSYLSDFAWSVGVHGDTIVAGSWRRGSATVYRLYGTYWAFDATLNVPGGGSGTQFGFDVATQHDTIVIGAPGIDDPSIDAGAAYLFRRVDNEWILEQEFQGDDESVFFGYSVAMDGDRIVCGAIYSRPVGAAYVFRKVGDQWIQEAKLTASDGDRQDNYGLSVSIAGDTIVVGSHRDDDMGQESGSAYVYRYDGTAWIEDQKLTASDGNASDFFGDAVANHGELVVVGSAWDDIRGVEESGSVYVYDGSGGTNAPPIADAGGIAPIECDAPGDAWVPLDGSASTDPDSTPGTNDDIVNFEWFQNFNTAAEELIATGETAGIVLRLGSHPVTLQVTDSFRHVRRDHAVKTVVDTTPPFGRIDSPLLYSCHGPDSLPVVLVDDLADTCDPEFERIYEPSFQPEIKLTRYDPDRGDSFGSSVSIDGDMVLVGASDDSDLADNAGAGYVFWRREDGSWRETVKLRPTDTNRDANFGNSVSISGDVALLGAYRDASSGYDSGAAYVFRNRPSAWAQEQKLIPSDGAPNDNFGTAVGVDGDVIVVGAKGDSDLGSRSGSAYVFRHTAEGWIEETKLLPEGGDSYDQFGLSASISGDTIIVGAEGDDERGSGAGAAYVFRHVGAEWILEAKLTASDASPNDRIGTFVSIRGDSAVVGAPRMNGGGGTYSGAAYVFRRHGTEWMEEAKLTASDGGYQDWFGNAAIDGDTIIVGAHSDDGEYRTDRGAVYLFKYIEGTWIETDKIVASDGQSFDRFGSDVALAGKLMVSSAPSADSARGAAYVKELNDGYYRHGDHVVQLTGIDGSGNSASTETNFTIDLDPPQVQVTEEILGLFNKFPVPFAEVFSADDKDQATGGVVTERLLLDKCPVLDGWRYGDGDGLLSDEAYRIDRVQLCHSLHRCGITELRDPLIGIEVADCGGNVDFDALTLRLKMKLFPGWCSGLALHPLPPEDVPVRNVKPDSIVSPVR